MLSRKAYFSFELKNKLLDKGFIEKEIDIMIHQLQESLIINDENTFQWYIHDWQIIKKKGKYLLERELKNKGAESVIIKDMIERYYDVDVDKKTIKELIKSKVEQKVHEKKAYKHKIALYLFQRGFAYDQFQKELEELK